MRDTVDLAELAEELGCHRYWVPEHHGMRGVASSAPAVLVAHLATVTSRLRVGSGGVLLPNHPPLVVAEQFGTLAALHPGRIDLGVGRAPGGPPSVVSALRRTDRPYRDQLRDLQAAGRGRQPAGTVVAGLVSEHGDAGRRTGRAARVRSAPQPGADLRGGPGQRLGVLRRGRSTGRVARRADQDEGARQAGRQPDPVAQPGGRGHAPR
ncbi:MsnO8 family LLM class oxidoreductase [Lentzea sp. NPDC102401]|uniref:MsnO8 family LLM class oxidoreductase n=1 Tax=Lentzea sp. NPDC102401 TaxID=3364128 RepID=UPI00380E7F47